MSFPSRVVDGVYQYEIAPGRWVSRQRINQLRNRQAHRARNSLNKAIEYGSISRGDCEMCGSSTGVEAHHEDYSKPYAVRWLCAEHHLTVGSRPHKLNDAPLQPPEWHLAGKRGKGLKNRPEDLA